jgi:hypothetical protein
LYVELHGRHKGQAVPRATEVALGTPSSDLGMPVSGAVAVAMALAALVVLVAVAAIAVHFARWRGARPP